MGLGTPSLEPHSQALTYQGTRGSGGSRKERTTSGSRVNLSQGTLFQDCLGPKTRVRAERSEPLELVVTGVSSNPSLSALWHRWMFRRYSYDRRKPQVWSEPSDVLQLLFSGENVLSLSQTCADFPLGPGVATTGGHYRCYGGHRISCKWSALSDPLDILITGQLPGTPSLSVQPGPTVSSGESVTLLCQSQTPVDTFLLSKERTDNPLLHLTTESPAQQSQAEFSMRAVSSALGGTYRCYGSHRPFPHLLSQPRDPLELTVSGKLPVIPA
ncbi:PREDICTED: LOW QUALITY PROTEIN: leukocyte immunoglobulin-like receptor subfamily B member 5 [Chinchilla lanigera]|uniref:LOW QUALITY PROTEIN: leukocyte immunoglobulin-like receptor subfamily B member 5 n=1 Tax=Chinchilla lanigera TaxID=34839 RepID=UPI0006984300|nr:PREDICTED: LOW QUALITY PROTEIN: leukocyte immunoglobulin-like receptor subfamily B member 5 [Chinchilla lanigera]